MAWNVLLFSGGVSIMKFLYSVFASVCAMALAEPASAQLFGTVQTGYAHINFDHAGFSNWNVSGAGALTLPSTKIGVQGNLSYAGISGNSENISDFGAGGTAYWSQQFFRIGAAADYDSIGSGSGSNGTSSSSRTISYGGFAEGFINRFTIGAKGGGFSGSGSDSSGGIYFGGEAVVYPTHDLALSATVDYANFTNSLHGYGETDFTTQGEWLLSEEIPVSAYAGYTVASLGGPVRSSNMIFVGFRFYANDNGTMPLVYHQRYGTVGWPASFGPIGANL